MSYQYAQRYPDYPPRHDNRHARRSSFTGGAPAMHQPAARKPLPRNFSKLPMGPSLTMNDLHDQTLLQPPPPLYNLQTYSGRGSTDMSRSRPTTPNSYYDDRPGSSASIRSRPGSRPYTPANDDHPSNSSEDSFQPPPPSRVASRQTLTKTPTAGSGSISQLAPADNKSRRKSIFSLPTRQKSERQVTGPVAWILGHPNKVAFDLEGLVAGRQMHDLWNPEGDCLVFLAKDATTPSFRVDSKKFAASDRIRDMIEREREASTNTRERSRIPSQPPRVDFTPPASYTWNSRPGTPETISRSASSNFSAASGSPYQGAASGLKILRMNEPVDKSTVFQTSGKKKSLHEGAERLIQIRNMFAFLVGQSLVATTKRDSLFAVFMCVSNLLNHNEFQNMDKSTFGEVAALSFDEYVIELGLADCRRSRAKTIESLVLGEQMRSELLYNEAYTHAVGKLDELQDLPHSRWHRITPTTKDRLGRSAIELEKRTQSIGLILTDFEFPDIAMLLANAKTSDDRKLVNFDAWQSAFDAMRKFFMTYYKTRFGSWPPKASSKKNNLETGGLNRLVLMELYRDLCRLYDSLVDRTDLTNRTVDGVTPADQLDTRPTARAMRRVLGSYDHSSPPVKPPVPFDLPKMPSMRSIRPTFGHPDNKKRDAKLLSKKLKGDEVARILETSHNIVDAPDSPFMQAYKKFELKTASGCDLTDVIDRRMGQWIFLYAVLQSLPLLVVDAPGVKHSEGVEYFLCATPRSGLPWATTSETRSKMKWYGIAGGGGVVSLPTDVIENSTDGIYRRSHCWIAADRWTADDPGLNTAVHEQQATFSPSVDVVTAAPDSLAAAVAPIVQEQEFEQEQVVMSRHASSTNLAVPRPTMGRRTRSISPAARKKRQSVINLGLEALPLPAGVMPEPADSSASLDGRNPDSRAAPAYEVDTSKTFDAILTGGQVNQPKKRK